MTSTARIPASDTISGILQSTARNAFILALQRADALRAQVSELQFRGDPSVAKAVEAARSAMLVANNLWSSSAASQGTQLDFERRSAAESVAVELGKVDKVAEDGRGGKMESSGG